MALLDPDAALRADDAAVATGAPKEVLGNRAVASIFAGRARTAQLALVNGAMGAVWASGDGRAWSSSSRPETARSPKST